MTSLTPLRAAVERRKEYNRTFRQAHAEDSGYVSLSTREAIAILSDVARLHEVVQEAFGTVEPELVAALIGVDGARINALDDVLASQDASVLGTAHGFRIISTESYSHVQGKEPGLRSALDELKRRVEAGEIDRLEIDGTDLCDVCAGSGEVPITDTAAALAGQIVHGRCDKCAGEGWVEVAR